MYEQTHAGATGNASSRQSAGATGERQAGGGGYKSVDNTTSHGDEAGEDRGAKQGAPGNVV